MKLVILTRYDGIGVSSRLRTMQYLPWLEAAGIEVTTAPFFDNEYLERFVPAASPPARRVIGCLCTMLSGWFRIYWLRAFLEAGLRRNRDVKIELTSRVSPDQLRATLGPELADRLIIAPARPKKVPSILQHQFASAIFFTDGLGKLGSSPTRMGEILGCGLPIVANEGVGDVARIVREHCVGVLARSATPQDMEAAWNELETLMADPGLTDHCRNAAEAVFSLKAGTESYRQLYADILRDKVAGAGKENSVCAD